LLLGSLLGECLYENRYRVVLFQVLAFHHNQVSGFIGVEKMEGKWLPLIGHVNHASECPVDGTREQAAHKGTVLADFSFLTRVKHNEMLKVQTTLTCKAATGPRVPAPFPSYSPEKLVLCFE
jgi:hypothetical protein